MSYDIWLEADLGGEEPARLDSDDPGNYTYNVDPMFALALGEPSSNGIQNGYEVVLTRKQPALGRFKDRQAGDCTEDLRAMVERMEADPEPYRALDPENGWGDYDGALKYLRAFLAACERNPNATVAMWL